MSAPEMTFDGHLTAAKKEVEDAGFSSQLWGGEFGKWGPDEVEASEAPHLPQLLTAFQCFLAFFVASTQKVWVHLAAEMQAGKTGVVTALIRLLLSNAIKLKMHSSQIFVLTGMNDKAWKKQTAARLPKCLRDNVHYSASLSKVVTALKCLTELSPEKKLSNIMIVIDESHIAAASGNRPNKLIYEAVRELCPVAEWAARGVRFLTISATDPAHVVMMTAESNEVPSQVVRLLTSNEYQSVEKLRDSGRVRFAEDTGDLHYRTTPEKAADELPKAIKEIQRVIDESFSDRPRYHLVRTRYGKQAEVMGFLRRAFPEGIIQPWDSSSKGKMTAEDRSSLSDMEDINDLLEQVPTEHTFIVLKNMFYAAKTMKDEHVGILYDRIGCKDDTNLQSLLGRACGYGRSKDSIVYTSKQTVNNYVEFWREISANPRFPPMLADIPASILDKKMTGVRVAHGPGARAILTVGPRQAGPGSAAAAGGAAAAAGGAGAAALVRNKANEDNFTSEWKEFSTFAEAKAWGNRIREPKQLDGFFQTSTTSKKTQRYDEVMVMKGGKKTANMPWGDLKVGKSTNRLYVGYRDETDNKTAVFVVRRLTRIA